VGFTHPTKEATMAYNHLGRVTRVLGLVVVLAGAAESPPRARAESGQGGSAKPEALLGDRKVESFRLGNGLLVLLRPIQGAKNTALVVVYSIGSDHDPEGHSGLGHMVEHVYVTAAAGDKKARTAQELFAHHPQGANGQTGDRHTVLATVFPEKDFEGELQDAADRMGKLKITAADLDRERPRMSEEIDNMFGAIPALGAQNQAREQIRPTPKGGRHGGQIGQIERLTADIVRERWLRYYKPRSAILALAGAIDGKKARELISQRFGGVPAGDPVPAPGEPGTPKPGTVRELKVKPAVPSAASVASLAYAAPSPQSDLYPAFLLLISRLWTAEPRLDNDPTGFPVYFTPLDDGAIVGVTSPLRAGESAREAVARLERFVAEATGPELADRDRQAVRQTFGFLLGLKEFPDLALAQNPYGVAFSMARRLQLGLDATRLNRALEKLTAEDLRRAAAAILASEKHAGAVVAVER
jgi:zinc protease